MKCIPKLDNSMLLAARRMISRDICNPSFPSKKITTLTMYVKGLCRSYAIFASKNTKSVYSAKILILFFSIDDKNWIFQLLQLNARKSGKTAN